MALAAGPLLAAVPAAAQWFGDPVMPPRAIGRIVMQEGYSGFSPPRLAGDVYIVHAIDEDGARVRLVIDAYDGRVLRPVRSVERFAPSRPIDRIRPRDEDEEFEREYIEREYIGPRRPAERDALLPPRAVPRVPPLDDPLSREARIEAPTVRPEPPSAKPAPNGRTSRVEQPARDSAAPAPRGKQRETVRQSPATAPAVPPIHGGAKPERAGEAEPSVTAAVPPPVAPKETAPASSAAPPAAKPAEAPKQPPSPPPAQAAQAQPATPPAATASPSGGPVRVIQGVTPILPQDSASPEK